MKIMEGATATIINKETGETIMKVENVKVTMRKKRLKKDCPCHKCHHWRAEREIRKLHKAMAAAFVGKTVGEVNAGAVADVFVRTIGPIEMDVKLGPGDVLTGPPILVDHSEKK